LKRFIKTLLSTLMIGLLVASAGIAPVQAQEETGEISFENMWLNVYPEYDDPRLLVWMGGDITGVEPPVTVSFLIPATAQINATASADALGLYSDGPPDREASSVPGWDEISFEVTTRTFRVEYYDPIIIGQTEKSISYEFRWLSPISDLVIRVLEPSLSSDYTVTPGGNVYTDTGGFTIHDYSYTEPPMDEPLRFEISYIKSDPRPSLTINPPATVADSGAGEGTGDGDETDLQVVIIILLVLVAGGIGYFLLTRKPGPKTRAERRKAARDAGQETQDKNISGKFCTQCGEPSEPSDKFCAGCGAKLS